ncbi:hypothetical protein BH10ACI2_BH10ACI2_12030 [soil metagenome]
MSVFEGKTQTEKNKMIAAAALGVIALAALYFAFGRSFFSSPTTTVTVKTPPAPKVNNPVTNRTDTALPSKSEQDLVYQSTPVLYNPGIANAPDPGRNIFAFYEPPVPGPTPIPIITPKATPTPEPLPTPKPPDMLIQSTSPPSVYVGTQSFTMEVTGDRFNPESRVFLNGSELPTRYVSPQRLNAEVSTKLVSQEGARSLVAQTPGGVAVSNVFQFTVQPAPKPTFQYIGMIGRKRFNNDTAYFTESGKPAPYGARLNDVLGGRFRLVDMSVDEVVFEDVQLGFKHRLPITKATATVGGGQPNRPAGMPDGFPTFNQGNPPGIPGNVPPYIPPQPPPQPAQKQKQDVDDDGDGGE